MDLVWWAAGSARCLQTFFVAASILSVSIYKALFSFLKGSSVWRYLFCSIHSRFNVVLVALALGRDLDGVALGDDVDVALEVSLRTARDVLGVGE